MTAVLNSPIIIDGRALPRVTPFGIARAQPWGAAAGIDATACWPGTTANTAVATMKTVTGATMTILVRVRRSPTLVEEYQLRANAFTVLTSSAKMLYTFSRRAFVGNLVFDWFRQPLTGTPLFNEGASTCADFAISFGVQGNPYSAPTNEPSGTWIIAGKIGHPNIRCDGLTITMADSATATGNIALDSNWPLGTIHFGSSLTITEVLACVKSASNIFTMESNVDFTAAAARREIVTMTGSSTAALVQLYPAMPATHAGSSATNFKAQGRPAIALNQSGEQKGNTFSPDAPSLFQFYGSDSSIRSVTQLNYGPPLRRQGATTTPYQYVEVLRGAITDDADFAKWRVSGVGLRDDLAPGDRTPFAWPTGATFEWYRTDYTEVSGAPL